MLFPQFFEIESNSILHVKMVKFLLIKYTALMGKNVRKSLNNQKKKLVSFY